MQITDQTARNALLNQVAFDQNGLVAAIAQAHESKNVLMVAWMNREALDETLKTGQVVYYSRSRKALWRKGETSGQTQALLDVRLDCDRDAVLLQVRQQGVACHTGRLSCFSWQPKGHEWDPVEAVVTDPKALYGENT
mgnify:CR=1 FL=1